VITGFNTDIEHEGVVYHVQTEDKGLETPLILSLVYTGGRILASKRTPYEDLIASGFDEKTLSERLQRQHKILCAAIKTGRIRDVIRLSQRENAKATTVEPLTAEIVSPSPAFPEAIIELPANTLPIGDLAVSLPLPPEKPAPAMSGPAAFLFFEPPPDDKLTLALRREKPLIAGEQVTLEVMVQAGPRETAALPAVEVSLKIMGTSFRPLAFVAFTDNSGVARFALTLPEFRTGRAALLLRAEKADRVGELRRIIHPQSTE
jgi:hypothetical protein